MVLDMDTACWALVFTSIAMVVHCTMLWRPLDNLSRKWFGWSYNPPWTWWARVSGVALALFGFAVAGLYWWLR
jgi:hypothetical protein